MSAHRNPSHPNPALKFKVRTLYQKKKGGGGGVQSAYQVTDAEVRQRFEV
jgi:hypothetical protein